MAAFEIVFLDETVTTPNTAVVAQTNKEIVNSPVETTVNEVASTSDS